MVNLVVRLSGFTYCLKLMVGPGGLTWFGFVVERGGFTMGFGIVVGIGSFT